MDLQQYLGKSENETINYCREHGLSYQVIVTKDPRATSEFQTEKRVIRLKWQQESLEILVGCFALATYYETQQN